MAYTGLLGTVGVGPALYTRWLLPLSIGFSAAALYMLSRDARRRRGYRPFFLGLVAVVGILSGKFSFDSRLLIYTGTALLLAASVWNSWPKRKTAERIHCDC